MDFPGKEQLILNPEIAKKYFKSGMPYSIQDVFDKIKKDNIFRIFNGRKQCSGKHRFTIKSFSLLLKAKNFYFNLFIKS